MNVQQLRRALLMASDGAEVRISFREVMVAPDMQVDAPVGGTCYSMADNSFTLYEAEDGSQQLPTVLPESPEAP